MRDSGLKEHQPFATGRNILLFFDFLQPANYTFNQLFYITSFKAKRTIIDDNNYDLVYEPTSLVPGNETLFESDDQFVIRSANNALGFSDLDLTFTGNWNSYYAEMAYMNFLRCQGANGAPDEVIDEFIRTTLIHVYLTNQYVDLNDIEKPFKKKLSVKVIPLETNYEKIATILIRENEYEFDDSLFPFYNSKEGTFYTFPDFETINYPYSETRVSGNGAVIRFRFSSTLLKLTGLFSLSLLNIKIW